MRTLLSKSTQLGLDEAEVCVRSSRAIVEGQVGPDWEALGCQAKALGVHPEEVMIHSLELYRLLFISKLRKHRP